MTAKTCRDCGELKTADEFYKGRNACKPCVRTAVTARRNANLENVRAYDRTRSKKRPNTAAKRAYKERNRDRINESQRARRIADPVAARAADRADYLRNKEAKAAASRRWKVANPERMAAYDARRRARKAGATLGKVDTSAVRASFDGCYLCAQPLSGEVHMDHVVPLARGGAHCTENLRLTHAACNLRKHDKLLSELDWYYGPTWIGVRHSSGHES